MQTATIIADEFGMKPQINNACNFDFKPKDVVQLCKGFSENDEIMFVGHNPSMSEVVQHVTGAMVELSTGAVVCVTDFTPPSTSNAMLKWLLTPRVIDPLFS